MAFVHLLPTSDISSSLFTQQTGKCADFEMRYVDCLEAYGYPHGLAKCQDYLDDLTECSLRIKQVMNLS